VYSNTNASYLDKLTMNRPNKSYPVLQKKDGVVMTVCIYGYDITSFLHAMFCVV